MAKSFGTAAARIPVGFVPGLIFWLITSVVFFLVTAFVGSLVLWVGTGFRIPLLTILNTILF